MRIGQESLNGGLLSADQALKRVLGALEDSGQTEETLVILATDHGIAFPAKVRKRRHP